MSDEIYLLYPPEAYAYAATTPEQNCGLIVVAKGTEGARRYVRADIYDAEIATLAAQLGPMDDSTPVAIENPPIVTHEKATGACQCCGQGCAKDSLYCIACHSSREEDAADLRTHIAELETECELLTNAREALTNAYARIAELEAALGQARVAFVEYEGARDSAQRMYHNYQEWTYDEIGPIDAARERFYDALRGGKLALAKRTTTSADLRAMGIGVLPKQEPISDETCAVIATAFESEPEKKP